MLSVALKSPLSWTTALSAERYVSCTQMVTLPHVEFRGPVSTSLGFSALSKASFLGSYIFLLQPLTHKSHC